TEPRIAYCRGSNRTRERAKVVFPQPDSPNSPTMLPASIRNETSETIGTAWWGFNRSTDKASTWSNAPELKGVCIDPFDLGRQPGFASRQSWDHVNVRVVSIRRNAVRESYVEGFHSQCLRDSGADLGDHVPDRSLFFDIQIVKRSDVASWSHH